MLSDYAILFPHIQTTIESFDGFDNQPGYRNLLAKRQGQLLFTHAGFDSVRFPEISMSLLNVPLKGAVH